LSIAQGWRLNNPTQSEIKQARKKAGLTQAQAAEVIRKKYRIWQYYESGTLKISPVLFDYFVDKTNKK
jgi:ribosome-binding protein aMBF1 (putative translation factor)